MVKPSRSLSTPQPRRRWHALLGLALCCVAACGSPHKRPARPGVGVFTTSQDIGEADLQGQISAPEPGTYVVSGAGRNLWGAQDEFHFAFSQIVGDALIGAEVDLGAPLGERYRKALLMFRASTDPDSAYVDVAVHENGVSSLQYRPYAGAPTFDLQSRIMKPRRARLTRRGSYFHAEFESVSGEQDRVGPIAVALPEAALVGIGVNSAGSSHLARVTFSDLELSQAVSLASLE